MQIQLSIFCTWAQTQIWLATFPFGKQGLSFSWMPSHGWYCWNLNLWFPVKNKYIQVQIMYLFNRNIANQYWVLCWSLYCPEMLDQYKFGFAKLSDILARCILRHGHVMSDTMQILHVNTGYNLFKAFWHHTSNVLPDIGINLTVTKRMLVSGLYWVLANTQSSDVVLKMENVGLVHPYTCTVCTVLNKPYKVLNFSLVYKYLKFF